MLLTISPHKEIEVNNWNISLIFVRDNTRKLLIKSSVGGFEGVTEDEWGYFNNIIKRESDN